MPATAASRGSLILLTACAPWVIPDGVRADVRLPAIIGDHMVLLRDTDACVWGWADEGEKVTLTPSWSGKPVETVATGGKWKVFIPTGAAGGPHTLTIAGKNTLSVQDILIGEVWVGSGQSNMEWTVAASMNAPQEIASAEHREIRLFTVERASSPAPADDVKGMWELCAPETVGKFSAVAFNFGRELHKELKVPVGLVAASWGGTEIEKWIPEPAMLADAEFAASIEARGAAMKDFDQALVAWRKSNDAADPGTSGNWEAPDLDDKEWALLPSYNTWDAPDLVNFDGVAWFRGTFDAPQSWAGQSGVVLELGAIDDQDRSYVNGKLVGATSDWTTPRVYALPPECLRAGANRVAIRVHDTGGLGGFSPGADQPSARRGAERAPLVGWRYRIGVAQSALKPPPESPTPQNSRLYNAMIAPLTPLAIRGVIWYQGESNVPRAAQYRKAFPMLISSWRQAWGRGDFPFYYVQIAPFAGYGSWKVPAASSAELREAQRLALTLPNTGMVVTTDLTPDVNDIHPSNKQAVGRRLAAWAISETYGRTGPIFSGPLYKQMRVDGDKVRLMFDHVGSGLTLRGGVSSDFVVADADRKFMPAQAEARGSQIIVWSEKVKNPVAVRFAWEHAPIPSFFNKDGYPASPFRTDDWPMATEREKW